LYKVSNDDVLKKVDEDKSIWSGIWKSIQRCIGHVLRYDRFCKKLLKMNVGEKTRGRRRIHSAGLRWMILMLQHWAHSLNRPTEYGREFFSVFYSLRTVDAGVMGRITTSCNLKRRKAGNIFYIVRRCQS